MPDANGFPDHHETARIEALEKHAAPMHWLVLVIAVAVCYWLADGYLELRADRALVSDKLADCANKKVVTMGDAMMWCRIVELIGE